LLGYAAARQITFAESGKGSRNSCGKPCTPIGPTFMNPWKSHHRPPRQSRAEAKWGALYENCHPAEAALETHPPAALPDRVDHLLESGKPNLKLVSKEYCHRELRKMLGGDAQPAERANEFSNFSDAELLAELDRLANALGIKTASTIEPSELAFEREIELLAR